MPLEWTPQETSRGTFFECIRESDGWMISLPKPSGPPTVELRYGRKREGQILPVMHEIGFFGSAAEAMLAAQMYAENAPSDRVADMTESIGLKPYFEGAAKLDLGGGAGRDGYFIFQTKASGEPASALIYMAPHDDDTHYVASMWTATMGDGRFQPVGAADLPGVEQAIMVELLKARLEKGPGRYADPMSMDDLGRWREARPPVEPEQASTFTCR